MSGSDAPPGGTSSLLSRLSLRPGGEAGDGGVPLSPQWLFNKPIGGSSGGGDNNKVPPGVSIGEPPAIMHSALVGDGGGGHGGDQGGGRWGPGRDGPKRNDGAGWKDTRGGG
eukprot:CAMPEP_0197589604 /NCGR_PEP_ID=MMETSP1326-20131121/10493_1 /TAXON_ID=1155430 /ORGANISM="Genus nov. species nov., Strain RCC2288" /LENGTH=111 /DNA_ID=CAMNT_0043154557 /DNA_START=283 /DNA_END=615 /DNA_ORIENTATION=-